VSLFNRNNKEHRTRASTFDRDLPKVNHGTCATVSDDFDRDALFTLEYSIAGRSKLKYSHAWIVIDVYPRQGALATTELMVSSEIPIERLRFDRSFVNLNERSSSSPSSSSSAATAVSLQSCKHIGCRKRRLVARRIRRHSFLCSGGGGGGSSSLVSLSRARCRMALLLSRYVRMHA
jgi:hypothetical protein